MKPNARSREIYRKMSPIFSAIVLCLKHSPCIKLSADLQVLRLARGFGNTNVQNNRKTLKILKT